jgi:biopolymer transport protein TolR
MAMGVGGGKNKLQSDINVTPLVDVVLVLLIIFMVVTPLLQMGYDVNVPPKATADTSQVISKEQLVVTQVNAEKVYLNREQVDIKQLPLRLSDILKRRRDKTVFYSADDELNYGLVMLTMDLIRNAGAERIGIITDKVTIPS